MRRLEGRDLDPERRAEIEQNIPDESRHYLTFGGTLFREYLDRKDGSPVNLLLILPMKVGVNSFIIQGPVDNDRFSGIARSEFTLLRDLRMGSLTTGYSLARSNMLPRLLFQ